MTDRNLPSASTRKTLVIVLGMHRSGTSAITRGLSLLGIKLGDRLHPPGPDNPTGFWEDEDCLEINNSLLAHLGATYDSLDFAWPRIEDSEEVRRLKDRACGVLDRRLSENGGLWGFKDPRVCRLLVFWQDVFQRLDCRVRYLIAVRNPVSVAQSLAKRNRLPFEKSYLLWLLHVLPSLTQTTGETRVVVDYDTLLGAPYPQLDRISRAFGMDLPELHAPDVAAYLQGFLDNGLRHSRSSLAELRDDSRATALVAELYEVVAAMAADTIPHSGLMKEFERRLEELRPAITHAKALEQDQTEIYLRLGASENETLRLAGACAAASNRITEFQATISESHGQIVELNGRMAERDTQVAELKHRLEERDSSLATMTRQLEERDGSLAIMARQLEERDDSLATMARQLEERDDSLATMARQLEERDGSLATMARQLEERDSSLATMARQLEERDSSLTSLARQLENREGRVSQLDAELQHVYGSNSWRSTAALRSARRLATRCLGLRFHDIAGAIWRRLPLPPESRIRIKNTVFTRAPALFRRSHAYQAWQAAPAPTMPVVRMGAPLPEPEYVPLLRGVPPHDLPARLIAFYLPQFHAIPENDAWWGEGFTEWTNVRRGKPQFLGHYQPHRPDELGYYNLLDRTVQARQIELAKLYGISGFCYYYYWFSGKRLLDQPLDNFLADPDLNHSFCLCWANENWSRRWDGLDAEILVAQRHSPEDDVAVAADLVRYLRDPRYIRVQGKPLLIVYRPSLLPSAQDTSARWRRYFREHGVGEVFLAYTQSFEAEDPAVYGFDAAIEFPPNNSAPPDATAGLTPVGERSTVKAYDWSEFVRRSESYAPSPYRLFRSVCPAWDNTARRSENATVFVNNTPAGYRRWLENAVTDTCSRIAEPDARLVFVNAWNEWAEGAHLEPDQKYGYAWLDATRKALTGEPSGPLRPKIVVVCHDAHPHGAQFLALGMVRSLSRDLKIEVHTVLLGEGRLRDAFAALSTVHDLLPGPDWDLRARQLSVRLRELGVERALANTTVSGLFAAVLARNGIACICLVHEMPGIIAAHGLSEHARALAASGQRLVFPAPVVAEGFAQFAEVAPERQIIRAQGLWRRNPLRWDQTRIRGEVRAALGMAPEAPLVLAVGYADHRKGIDLFARAAVRILEHRPDAIFVWIGHWDETLRDEIGEIIRGREQAFHFLGYEPETARWHVAADVYALTSREDPFPNVVLESLDAGVPVVAFAGSGGGSALVGETGGRTVPMADVEAFAEAVLDLVADPNAAQALGRDGSALVDRNYAFRSYLFDLCSQVGLTLPRISVVVPNLNYAKHICRRLETIVNQTLPIFELIILDDASTDDSVEVITTWLREHSVEARLVVNECNSGSVFRQWAKGVELASGDFLWIAEADDLCEPDFLGTVLAPMERDAEVILSTCESRQIDGWGTQLAPDYHDYRKDVDEERWRVPYVAPGIEEIERCLAIKNTIPNVSAVLFRRDRVAQVLAEFAPELAELKCAGDWLVYWKILRGGKIAFHPRSLNLHRRHDGSVVAGLAGMRMIEEIHMLQAAIAREHCLSDEVARTASAYLQSLRERFQGERAEGGSPVDRL